MPARRPVLAVLVAACAAAVLLATPSAAHAVPAAEQAQVTVSAADAMLAVSWTAPPADLVDPVTRYDVGVAPVHSSAAAAAPRVAHTVQTHSRIGGLANGVRYRVRVIAETASGAYRAVGASTGTPRRLARLSADRPPPARVTFGHVTTVRAHLVAMDGRRTAGQQVELQGRTATGRWHRLASGRAHADGRLTLRARLRRNTQLRLHHRRGAVVAANAPVHPVHVAVRVVRHSGATRTLAGDPVHVAGAVGPRPPAHARVQLQSQTHRRWHTVTSTRVRRNGHYAMAWHPSRPGRYPLRVLRPAAAANAAGTSAVWVQHVRLPSAADLAREILRSRRISLATVHVSGVHDDATARDDIREVAAGHLARRSSYQNGPGGAVAIDIRLLRAVVAIGRVTSIEVSEVAGGSHAPNSDHYRGRAVDIDRVGGRAVGGGAAYGVVVRLCRAYGAKTIYDPGYDPYGGHANHVHCGWR